MKIWTYHYPVDIDGQRYALRLETGLRSSRLLLTHEGQTLEDRQDYSSAPYRLHRLQVDTAQGPLLFELGPRTVLSYGVKVSRQGQVLYRSHPDPFAYLARVQAMMAKRQRQASAPGAPDFSRLKGQAPAIAVDIALGLLFFVMGKLGDLRTAALVTAAAGLALLPLQWAINRFAPPARRVDLLGGMALFGVVVMLLSAGFSWYFESEFLVQLKASVIGGLVACAFGVDALASGRWLGKRVMNYLVYSDIDARRLSAGMCAMGLALAGVNAAVASLMSKDAWLWYTLWGDLLLVMVLSNLAIHWARRKPGALRPRSS
ncbi:septation protein IspZ [Roseateles sp.]|uniref:septation protein IspZ n=1 Tax=Roseateles sp. TaxID=1971397 RepID=UPI003D0FF498